MTPAIIAITPGAGQLLDAVTLVVGANVVVRETMVIADPTAAGQLAGVTPGGALMVDGSAVPQPVINTGTFAVQATLAAGSAIIGHVIVDSGTITASIAAAQTIAVTNTGTFVVQATLAAETTKVIGRVNQGTTPWIITGNGVAGTADTGVVTVQGIASMTPLLVTASFAVAQHVIVDSGAITANIGTTNGLALDSSLSTIDTDLKSNITLHAGTNVIGKVSQDTSPWIISGAVTLTSTTVTADNITQVSAVVNAGNSSIVSLNAGLSFTGSPVMDLVTLGEITVQVQVLTDQPGTLQIQFSPDNTNWDHIVTSLVTANNSTSVATGIHGRYCRIVMTNTSASNQTFLRLQTILVPGVVSPTIKDLDTAITADDNALVSHSVITGRTTAGGGSFVDVKVNPSGALTCAVTASDGDVYVRSNAAATFPVTATIAAAQTLATVTTVTTITNPVSTKTALTPSAPTAASVGIASGAAVAINANRKGLILINTSANYISLGFGANAAVLYSGITLNPNGGTFVMDEFTFTTQAVNAIASGATSNLAIQEMA